VNWVQSAFKGNAREAIERYYLTGSIGYADQSCEATANPKLYSEGTSF
jgi:hypothetical protein